MVDLLATNSSNQVICYFVCVFVRFVLFVFCYLFVLRYLFFDNRNSTYTDVRFTWFMSNMLVESGVSWGLDAAKGFELTKRDTFCWGDSSLVFSEPANISCTLNSVANTVVEHVHVSIPDRIFTLQSTSTF